MSNQILVAESNRFSADAVERLRTAGEVTLADLDRPGLLSAVADADVLCVRLRHRIDEEVFSAGERLRVIATPTTGLNHIDLESAKRRGVRVISLRGEANFLREVRATAEHTVALMLALLRNVPAAAQHVVDGQWSRDLFCGRELHGKTIGIIGFGRLGKLVAEYLQAFGTRILAVDPVVSPDEVPAYVEMTPLHTLLRESEIVTLHVNLCDQTIGFFGREQFGLMRSDSWFINTSRGELVDESALYEALESGKLSGAALDVLTGECSDGMSHHRLVDFARQNRRLLITPHIGGCTIESMHKTEVFLAERICAVLQESSVTP